MWWEKVLLQLLNLPHKQGIRERRKYNCWRERTCHGPLWGRSEWVWGNLQPVIKWWRGIAASENKDDVLVRSYLCDIYICTYALDWYFVSKIKTNSIQKVQ